MHLEPITPTFSLPSDIDAKMLSHPERHAYERILRRALSLPKRPAVVDFEAFAWVSGWVDVEWPFLGREGAVNFEGFAWGEVFKPG